jgi:threonine/homoserine/homoserine lactone efflux protein
VVHHCILPDSTRTMVPMTAVTLLAFAGLCLLLSVTPGPDTFLVLRISLQSAGAGIAAALGSAVASLVWAALVGIGLAAVLEDSAEVFRWLKIAGGLYLLYLGISSLIRARRTGAPSATAGHSSGRSSRQSNSRRYSRRAGFGAGAISTLLNPKVGLFYLAVVPQFIPHGGATFDTAMVLGAIESTIGLLYLVAVSIAAAKAMAWLQRPRVSSWLERGSSGIIAALGLGVLASSAGS